MSPPRRPKSYVENPRPTLPKAPVCIRLRRLPVRWDVIMLSTPPDRRKALPVTSKEEKMYPFSALAPYSAGGHHAPDGTAGAYALTSSA